MRDWKKVLLKETDSIRHAVEMLDVGALQIVLVVDDEGKLLGTVTDGDVRRSLLQHISLESPVLTIMNKQPLTAKMNEEKSTLLSIMEQKDINHIPLLDDEGKLVGLETLQILTRKAVHHYPVFLMAGGFGMRLSPMTKDTPKPMLRLGQRPIIESIIKSFIEQGFRQFYIAVHYLADQIIDYFGDGSAWGISIEYVHEERPLGTAGALGLLAKQVEIHSPMIMMNADILTKVNFEHLMRFHEEHVDSIATMCVRRYDFQVPYGVIEAKDRLVAAIKEKPVHNFFVNAGIYVLQPAVLSYVPEGITCDMPTLLEALIAQKQAVSMFPIHEYWLDIGRKDDFGKAEIEFNRFFVTENEI